MDASWFGWFLCCLDLNIFFCLVFCFVIFLFVFLFLPSVVREGDGGSSHYNRKRKGRAVSQKPLQARGAGARMHPAVPAPPHRPPDQLSGPIISRELRTEGDVCSPGQKVAGIEEPQGTC